MFVVSRARLSYMGSARLLCLLVVRIAGLWKAIAGRVVHVDVRGECVCCGWMQCSAGIVCLV